MLQLSSFFAAILCLQFNEKALFSSFARNQQQKQGPRMKCSACKIIAHASCIAMLMERSQLACKPTFRDVGVRQYREQTRTLHHWIHRRTEKGKCKQCGKVSRRNILMNLVKYSTGGDNLPIECGSSWGEIKKTFVCT
jgi:hypothetical protein